MVGDIIKELRNRKGLYQEDLAKDLSVSKSAISMWEQNKRTPDVLTLARIADYFGVSIERFISTEDGKQFLGYYKDLSKYVEQNQGEFTPEKVYHVPLYESISAGFGAYADERVIGSEPMCFNNPYDVDNTIAVKVKGDSMQPTIYDRDIVFINKDLEYSVGDIVAVIQGEEGYVKRLSKLTPSTLAFSSDNEKYPDMVFKNDDMSNIHIVGVVTRITHILKGR